MTSYKRPRSDFLGHPGNLVITENPDGEEVSRVANWYCPSCRYTVAATDDNHHVVDGDDVWLHRSCVDQYMSQLLREAVKPEARERGLLRELERIMERYA